MRNVLAVILLCFLLCSCSDNRADVLAKANQSLSSGDTQKARALFLQRLHSDPYDVDAIRGMVSVAKIAAATGETVQWCKSLLELYPWDRYANITVGKQLQDEGNLKDAAARYVLAYQNSDFQKDKLEVYSLLLELKKLESLRIQHVMASETKQPTQ